MAKKKENKLSYLQMPLPEGRKASKMVKRSWSGLNYRHTIDTGALSMEKNISTLEAPYLTPSPMWDRYKSGYKYGENKKPIGLFGFDDFLIVIFRDDEKICIDYIAHDGVIYHGILKNQGADEEDEEILRSVVKFNVYDTPTDPILGKYQKKLLIFPDRASMNFTFKSVSSLPENPELDVTYRRKNFEGKYIYTYYTYEFNKETNEGSYTEHNSEDYFYTQDMNVLIKEYENSEKPYLPPETANRNFYYMNTSTAAKDADTLYGKAIYRWVVDESDSKNTGWKISTPPSVPNIKYATVHLSRVFGVDDDRVYASGYNDYTNWNLDNLDDYNESNAWCSPAQSNTRANGAFTGITTFGGHVVCFKRDYMHEIYNTKNPFRIQDIYAEGAIDNRTIQDVDGQLIFVSEDNVKIYTGSNPRIISYYLNISRYTKAVSGTDGRFYYLFCEDQDGNNRMFVYDTIVEQWSEQYTNKTVLWFANNKDGMYVLCKDGAIYRIDTDEYSNDESIQEWSFETDLFTNETVDIKHLSKIQLLAYFAEDADMAIYALYDDEEFDANTSHLLYRSDRKKGQIAIRVKPRQTASYGIKLHFEGLGYVRLYELEMIFEQGGGLYV